MPYPFFSVSIPDGHQAPQGHTRVIFHRGGQVGRDQGACAAGEQDLRRFAQLGRDACQHPIHHGSRPKHGAGLHGVHGVTAQNAAGGRFHPNRRKLRRHTLEHIERSLHAGRNGRADQHAVPAEHGKRRHRAHIHHHAGQFAPLGGPDCIGDQVAAQCARLVNLEIEPSPHTRAHAQGRAAGKHLDCPLDDRGHRWDHRTEHYAFHVRQFDPIQAAYVAQLAGILFGSQPVVGCYRGDKLQVVPAETAQPHVTVPNVERKQHIPKTSFQAVHPLHYTPYGAGLQAVLRSSVPVA